MGIKLDDANIRDGLRVYAIGDVHGCLSELKEILSLIDDDLSRQPIENHRLIFVGDYTDRGPNNPETLEFLINLRRTRPNLTCLKGNHDKGLFDFVTRNGSQSTMFFRYGGASTLRQYRIDIPKQVAEDEWMEPEPNDVPRIVRQAQEKIDPSHLHFLNALPYFTEQDDYFFCHAGIKPGVSLDDQAAGDLIWIRDEFLLSDKLYDKVVIHGHTSRLDVDVHPNRINIDTRCHATGVLTCLALEKDQHRILQTGATSCP